MDERREIMSIQWFPWRPDWYELVYDDGDSERVRGPQADAAMLAAARGMHLASTRDGTVQWDRRDSDRP